MSSKLPVIVGWLFVLFGFIAFYFSVVRFKKAKESSNWPSCNGKLLEVKMIDYGTQGRNFSLIAKYQYSVDKRNFIGARICFYSLAQKSECQLIFDELKREEFIKVYFNPKNCEESVLIPGLDKRPYGEMFISIVAIFSGALLGLLF